MDTQSFLDMCRSIDADKLRPKLKPKYIPPDEKYWVRHGNIEYAINEKLVKLKNISDETLAKIVELHVDKLKIFDNMNDTNSSQMLHTYAALIEEIEYELQSLWGFVEDKNYHRWWLVPKCICPEMDNEERLGTKYRVINKDCPVHGEII